MKFARISTTFALLVSLLNFGCVYSFKGFYPSKLRKVVVPVFANETLRYGLEDVVTQSFINAIREDGRLTIVSEKEATMKIQGRIIDYKKEPFEYDASGNVESYRITITAAITFYDLTADTTFIPEKRYSGWGIFDANTETEEDGVRRAVRELVDSALRTLFTKE